MKNRLEKKNGFGIIGGLSIGEFRRFGVRRLFLPIVAAALYLAPSCVHAQDRAVTVWAEDRISVDASSSGARLAVGEVSLWHDPDWCTGGTNVEGAVAVLKAVTAPDTANAVTSTVEIADSGKLAFTGWTGSGYVRFVMDAELDGRKVGDTLVADVSFGTESAFAAGLAFDARTNALQEAVNAKAKTSLNYDLKWADVATGADISLVCTKRAKNGSVISVSTNRLALAGEPASGNVEFPTANLQWGDYVLLLREYSADGLTILETESPAFSIAHVYGTCVILR